MKTVTDSTKLLSNTGYKDKSHNLHLTDVVRAVPDSTKLGGVKLNSVLVVCCSFLAKWLMVWVWVWVRAGVRECTTCRCRVYFSLLPKGEGWGGGGGRAK